MSERFYRGARLLFRRSMALYYRRIEIEGRDRIPPSGAAILVANHPNSVADAFLLASCLTARKINFIARDAITRAPVLGWLARQMGVVGVARAMDYARERDLARQRNETTIAACVPQLLGGELLAIFGEGIATDARRLHTIRKGAMRFGCAAEQAANFCLGLRWIPVGINYSAKQRFRSDVWIRVGQPFGLFDLDPDPASHGQQLLQRGTARLQREIESLIVNIESEELAPLIDRLAEFLARPEDSVADRIDRHQQIARAVFYYNVAEPRRVMEIQRALVRYERLLAAARLTDPVVRQRHPERMLWVNSFGVLKHGALMLPNLYGWANSFIPRWCAALAKPLGRTREDSPAVGSRPQFVVAKEALWGTIGGWVGAATGFSLQTYFVLRWSAGRWGFRAAAVIATLYALSLIPSWRLFVRRRDVFRERLGNFLSAARFLLHGPSATKLQLHRRAVERRVRELLAAYRAAAPPASPGANVRGQDARRDEPPTTDPCPDSRCRAR